MYDITVAFTDEQIDLIYKAGLTIGELRDFLSRFPDQELDTAIGGALMEKQHIAEGATIPLESDLQETVTEEKLQETETSTT